MKPSEKADEVKLSFQEGDNETLLVTPISRDLYRLEETSVFGEISYHDVIEAEPNTDGTLRFRRLVTPSGLITVSWILAKTLIESPALSLLLGKVIAVGGNWERLLGGCLILHLPPAEHDRLSREFNNLFSHWPTDDSDKNTA
jgi:hypothetical protein